MLELEDKQALVIECVNGAVPIGEVSKRIRASRGLFPPCTVADSLLEALAETAKNATSGDVVLLSPACSSWDQSRDHQHRGEVLCQAVKSIGRGVHGGTPNIKGKTATAQQRSEEKRKQCEFASGFFEAKPRSKANQNQPTPQ
jgi:hypothetical protein